MVTFAFIGAWDCQIFMVDKQFQTNILIFLWKIAIVSEDLIVMGNLFHIVVAATQKVQLHLVLGTKHYLEIDDLRVLEKCSRLTKYVGCPACAVKGGRYWIQGGGVIDRCANHHTIVSFPKPT